MRLPRRPFSAHSSVPILPIVQMAPTSSSPSPKRAEKWSLCMAASLISRQRSHLPAPMWKSGRLRRMGFMSSKIPNKLSITCVVNSRRTTKVAITFIVYGPRRILFRTTVWFFFMLICGDNTTYSRERDVANFNVLASGPSGKLLTLMDRHPFRPAHIHILVSSCAHYHPFIVVNFVQRD